MSWVLAGSYDDMSPGTSTCIELGEHRIAIFRTDDEVYAIGDRCSHAEASLSEGEVDDFEVECPRHGALFDIRTGEACSLPATRPVPSYRTDVRDGEIFLHLEES